MNMDDIMQQALNITRAQAGVRPMSASEVAAYAAEIAKGIRTILVLQFFWGKLGLPRPAVPLHPLWVSP